MALGSGAMVDMGRESEAGVVSLRHGGHLVWGLWAGGHLVKSLLSGRHDVSRLGRHDSKEALA